MTEETNTTNTNPDMVPRSRMNEYKAARDAALAEVATLKANIGDMQSKVDSYAALSQESEKYKTELTKAQSDLAKQTTVFDHDKAILSLGVKDQDVMDLVKLKFAKADEGTKFEDFLETQKEEAYLKSFIDTPAVENTDTSTKTTGTETETNTEGGADKPAGNTNLNTNVGGAETPAPGAGSFKDPAYITSLSPAEYAKNRAEILANAL